MNDDSTIEDQQIKIRLPCFIDPLPESDYRRLPLPFEAAFLTGQCFLTYRKRGGTRPTPMPDFYIGAHAALAGLTLLTRDARRYRDYFPTLRVIAP